MVSFIDYTFLKSLLFVETVAPLVSLLCPLLCNTILTIWIASQLYRYFVLMTSEPCTASSYSNCYCSRVQYLEYFLEIGSGHVLTEV